MDHGRTGTENLVIVSTVRSSYAGYRSPSADGRALTLERAAMIDDPHAAAADIALRYFGERAGRRLGRYELPYTAVVELREDSVVDSMIEAYAALSRVANKGVAGRITTARLKKMLGGRS